MHESMTKIKHQTIQFKASNPDTLMYAQKAFCVCVNELTFVCLRSAWSVNLDLDLYE